MIPLLLLAGVIVVVDALAVPGQIPLGGQSGSGGSSRRLNGRFLHITGEWHVNFGLSISMVVTG